MTTSEELVQLGRYRILGSLGQGAMADVYLAELETIGGFKRKVALKVVRDEFARDPKFTQLLTREAMIGSHLQHPNIVETLEFDDIDGRMFLALEFVEGETVEELLERRKEEGQAGIQVDLAIEIIIQVLQGLSYAHNFTSPDDGKHLGIIHRDLKPGNLMVSRHGHVKIMDFGIAKAKFQSATLTAQGQVRGTPIYMAPEQVTGKVLDGRTDQFAVATVLYELITGEQLFIGRNLLDIMRMVCKAEVGKAVAKLQQIDGPLAIAAQRMWSVKPTDRFPDCADAAVALEECLQTIKEAMERGEDLSPEITSLDSLAFEPIFESASLPEMPQGRDQRGRLRRFLGMFGRKATATPTRPQSSVVSETALNLLETAGSSLDKDVAADSGAPGGSRGQGSEADYPSFAGGRMEPEPFLLEVAFSSQELKGSMSSEILFEEATLSTLDTKDEDLETKDEEPETVVGKPSEPPETG